MTDLATLCQKMEDLHASDLFLSVGRSPVMRRDGVIVEVPGGSIVEAAGLQDFFSSYLPVGTWDKLQAERDLDIGLTLGQSGRFRLNLSFQRGNLSLAVRKVPSGELDFASLALPETLARLAELPRGMILITGATGSGKSTTLAALVNHINQTQRRHIVTIEDPIEFVHADRQSVISQREIGSDTRSFSMALRHVVRQNPDVIIIGELRDQETIATAISAAMTGHLVAATLHTVDVQQTLERILNYFPDGLREQVALDFSLALQGIISQRLLPRQDGSGRVPALEILIATPLGRRLIASRELENIPELLKSGSQDGMLSFNRSLARLHAEGVVSLEIAARAATNREEFLLLSQGMETGIDTLRAGYSGDVNVGLSLKKLLRDALVHGASDLLLSAGSPPVIRLDGELRPYDTPVLTPADTQKLVFSVLTLSQRANFETSREIDFALSVRGLLESGDPPEHRFRVNGFYQKGSIAAALRLISSRIPTAVELGLPKAIINLARKPQGLVLVTGPTGQGKSTTLAALVDEINRTRSCHIITIEDPIEFVHQHQCALIEQREVTSDTHSFAQALKYVLRQDPDVILIGEMRDPETISATLTAAETGHLVFATLHTNDVVQSIDRVIDTFPPEQQNQVRAQLAACLEAVISQRLLPRHNKSGRVAAFSILLGSTAVRAMIRDKKTHQLSGVIETAAKDGMITMDRALQNLFERGEISRSTLLQMTTDPQKYG